MTKKLYDEAPYERDFTAKVTELHQGKQGVEVALDQTLFFPEEGGQSPDLGTLNGIKVKDVQIRDNVIWHTLDEGNHPQVGQQVEGHIDFDHRYDLMQQHSGEHVLSGIVHNTFGYNNVGFHLTEEIVTLDFDGPLSMEQVEQVEKAANEAVRKNLPIRGYYPEKETLKTLDYRSKKELDGPIRIVEIQGVDLCACCAPHVATTGEIGSIHVVNRENYKGGVRLEIMCAKRAEEESRTMRKILKALTKELSTNMEELPETVKRIKETSLEQKGEIGRLTMELLTGKAEKIPAGESLVLFEEEMDATVQRNYVNLLMPKVSKIAAVMAKTSTEDVYKYIIGSETIDLKALQAQLKERLQAKGGGKTPMIQGTLEGTREEIESLLLK
ncbi:MAG: alanyl-tRNA editing protein [Lachnospiraceae bacterium]|nr:alanyl-tRNA editing protein [Lachnospiraceae bacterium]